MAESSLVPISLVDSSKIGVDASRSHTTAAMHAGHAFAVSLQEAGLINAITRVQVSVHGLSVATGRCQTIERALMLGLAGYTPGDLDVWRVNAFFQRVEQNGALHLLDQRRVPFSPLLHIAFPRHAPQQQSHGMQFRGHDGSGTLLLEAAYSLIGQGDCRRASSDA